LTVDKVIAFKTLCRFFGPPCTKAGLQSLYLVGCHTVIRHGSHLKTINYYEHAVRLDIGPIYDLKNKHVCRKFQGTYKVASHLVFEIFSVKELWRY